MLGKWFNKTEPSKQKSALPTPLNLRLKAAVDIDPIPFQFLRESLQFEFPGQTQIIEAQGKVNLGAGAYLHRYYTSDDAFLQVSTTGGFDDEHVDEVKFFVFHDTLHPATQAEWEQWTGINSRIGDQEYTLNSDTVYHRAWSAESEGSIVAVKFEETVTNNIETESSYTVIHLAMLYERQLPGLDKYEYLLISAEHTDDDACIVLSVGVDLDPVSFTVV